MKELDQEERQHGAIMQEISEAHQDLLRNLIDQQLWLSKGKELGITGETELVNRLNEIRKQYNLATLEDLEKAAEEQGVSYEDFKANIRNQIITQEVMRAGGGPQDLHSLPARCSATSRQHKQEYAQPESVRLAEILVSTPAAGPAGDAAGAQSDDPQKVAEAKAKADDIEAKLHAGGDFSQLAKLQRRSNGCRGRRSGPVPSRRTGQSLEDQTFALKAGQYTEPIRTKQGYVILKVVEHTPGGVPPFKDVEQDVEQAYYMSKMEPAMRDYLTQMRDEAYIEIKPGYVDTGASPNKRVFPIAYSAYTPPAPKKKKKVERTRFRETTHAFRQKSPQAAPTRRTGDSTAKSGEEKEGKRSKSEEASMKPGKKEKIRFGKAPQETLPNAAVKPNRRRRSLAARKPRPLRRSRTILSKTPLVQRRRPASATAPESTSRKSQRVRGRMRPLRNPPTLLKSQTARNSLLRWDWAETPSPRRKRSPLLQERKLGLATRIGSRPNRRSRLAQGKLHNPQLRRRLHPHPSSKRNASQDTRRARRFPSRPGLPFGLKRPRAVIFSAE